MEGQITVVNHDSMEAFERCETPRPSKTSTHSTLSLTPEVGSCGALMSTSAPYGTRPGWSRVGVGKKLDALDGQSVIDVACGPTGSFVLSYAGDLYGPISSALSSTSRASSSPELTSYRGYGRDGASVEFFDGALFLGTAAGEVLRAPGSVD